MPNCDATNDNKTRQRIVEQRNPIVEVYPGIVQVPSLPDERDAARADTVWKYGSKK